MHTQHSNNITNGETENIQNLVQIAAVVLAAVTLLAAVVPVTVSGASCGAARPPAEAAPSA